MSRRVNPFFFVLYCQADWADQVPALCWWERSFLLSLATTYVDPALQDLSLADPSSVRSLNEAVEHAQLNPPNLGGFPTVLRVFEGTQVGAEAFVAEAYRWGFERDAARFVTARTQFNPRPALVRERAEKMLDAAQ